MHIYTPPAQNIPTQIDFMSTWLGYGNFLLIGCLDGECSCKCSAIYLSEGPARSSPCYLTCSKWKPIKMALFENGNLWFLISLATGSWGGSYFMWMLGVHRQCHFYKPWQDWAWRARCDRANDSFRTRAFFDELGKYQKIFRDDLFSAARDAR